MIVVASELNQDSTKMVNKLREVDVESYMIQFASIYSIMPKITKVVVSCYALMSDGGIINQSGIYSIGLVSKNLRSRIEIKLKLTYLDRQGIFDSFPGHFELLQAHAKVLLRTRHLQPLRKS